LVKVFSVAIFPLLLLAFALCYLVDQWTYVAITREGDLVETATAILFAAAFLVSSTAALQARHTGRRRFYVIFGLVCLLAFLEEINWGQVLFGFGPPELFLKLSAQHETSIHDVLVERFRIRTITAVTVLMLAFGVLLPASARLSDRLRSFLDRVGIAVPPLSLSVGFLLGSLLANDYVTTREEEIAELFFSLALFLFITMELRKRIATARNWNPARDDR
jgi:hypothetical protein